MQLRSHLMAAAILVGGTASCSDAPSGPTQPPPRDVSTVIPQVLAVAFGTYTPGSQPVDLAGPCTYSTLAAAFVCPPATISGVVYTLSYMLLDADGHALQAPSAAAVTMRAVIDGRGQRATTNGDLTVTTDVTDHREMQVTGLQAARRTMSGTLTTHLESIGSGPGATHSIQDETGSTTNVVIGGDAPWPVSGVISGSNVTSVLSSPLVAPTTLHTSTQIEFDGSSVVTIITSTDSFSLRCRYDLAGRVATSCS